MRPSVFIVLGFALLGAVRAPIVPSSPAINQRRSMGARPLGPQGRGVSPPRVGRLIKFGVVKFALPAPAIVAGDSKSDGAGDIFIQSGSATALAEQEAQKGPVKFGQQTELRISELKLDSAEQVIFRRAKIPNFPYEARLSFNASPRGRLYMLVQAFRRDPYSRTTHARAHYFLERYHRDGSYDEKIELQPPPMERLDLSRFGVFGDGNFLVAGMNLGPRPVRGVPARPKPFLGVFSATGGLVKQVDLSAHERVVGKSNGGVGGYVLAISRSILVSSTTGDAIYYVQQRNPLVVFTVLSTGSVSRVTSAKVPGGGLVPMEAGLFGPGLLYFHFAFFPTYPLPAKQPADLVGVFDVDLGSFDAVYRLPAGTISMGVGGDLRGDILVLSSSKHHRLEVIKYAPG